MNFYYKFGNGLAEGILIPCLHKCEPLPAIPTDLPWDYSINFLKLQKPKSIFLILK